MRLSNQPTMPSCSHEGRPFEKLLKLKSVNQRYLCGWLSYRAFRGYRCSGGMNLVPHCKPHPKLQPSWPCPSEAYLHQYTRPSLVPIVTCRLFDVKKLPESNFASVPENKFRNILKQIEIIKFTQFHGRCTFENIVCIMAAILSQFQS